MGSPGSSRSESSVLPARPALPLRSAGYAVPQTRRTSPRIIPPARRLLPPGRRSAIPPAAASLPGPPDLPAAGEPCTCHWGRTQPATGDRRRRPFSSVRLPRATPRSRSSGRGPGCGPKKRAPYARAATSDTPQCGCFRSLPRYATASLPANRPSSGIDRLPGSAPA